MRLTSRAQPSCPMRSMWSPCFMVRLPKPHHEAESLYGQMSDLHVPLLLLRGDSSFKVL